MQNKKYQIFVSSTYEDLKEERKAIIENISTMGHLPVGMELFVASDDEQFEYIKKVIDNCDYYVLVLGGRYGSVSPRTGKSYTEMEYDYAIEKGLPVLAFPYANIEQLPEKLKDKDLCQIKKFYEKASNGRMCTIWDNKEKLLSSVIISLTKIFAEKPQRGWLRPDEVDNTTLLAEMNNLRKENQTLKEEVENYKKSLTPEIENLADMDEKFKINFQIAQSSGYIRPNYMNFTWNEIYSNVAPYLISPTKFTEFVDLIKTFIIKKYTPNNPTTIIIPEMNDVQTIKIQLEALRLIKIEIMNYPDGQVDELISLTVKGNAYMKQVKTIKSQKIF